MNCKYCGSQVFIKDRCCVKCGAPFINLPKDIYEDIDYEVQGGKGNKCVYRYSIVPRVIQKEKEKYD